MKATDFSPEYFDNGQQQHHHVLPENPMRAVWAGVFMLAGWFILLLMVLFGKKLMFRVSDAPFTLLSAAVLGTAAYLISVRGVKWKITGSCFGVVAALLLGLSMRMIVMYRALIEGNPIVWTGYFLYIITRVCPAVLMGLGVSFLLTVLRRGTGKGMARKCGLVTGALYLFIQLLFLISYIRISLSRLSENAMFGQQLIETTLPILSTALTAYLVCMAVYALCNMPQTDVRLHGIGFVWSILALLGAVFASVSTILIGARILRGEIWMGTYGFSILQGISALTGYALLLYKKRTGLYLILLGVGLMLGAQAMIGLRTFGYQDGGWSLIISAILGALNPLFAYLSVRAAR